MTDQTAETAKLDPLTRKGALWGAALGAAWGLSWPTLLLLILMLRQEPMRAGELVVVLMCTLLVGTLVGVMLGALIGKLNARRARLHQGDHQRRERAQTQGVQEDAQHPRHTPAARYPSREGRP